MSVLTSTPTEAPTPEKGKQGSHRLRRALIYAFSSRITVPAVLLTSFLSSCAAFVLARFSFAFNLATLALFTAANLLPPQALLIPVYRMFRAVPIPDGSRTLARF
jgi:ABC-type glycerol-3-phosphate transport system permease component